MTIERHCREFVKLRKVNNRLEIWSFSILILNLATSA